MKNTLLFILCLILPLALFSCGGTPPATETAAPVTVAPPEEMFVPEDVNPTYSEEDAAVITLSGATATTENDAVRIIGSSITILDEGTYILRGTFYGTLTVLADATDAVTLVLDGASLQAMTAPPLRITKAAKATVIVKGEGNTVKNTGTGATEENLSDAILSKVPLVLSGDGSLYVRAADGHGITVKDSLTVTGGHYTVHAKGHALDANKGILLTGCEMTLTAGKDGIHAESLKNPSLSYLYIADGRYTVTAAGDAITTSDTMQIRAGEFTLTAGGGSRGTTDKTLTGGKGLKAAAALLVAGGSLTVDAADDAIHSDLSVEIGDATLTLSTADDAIHANDTLRIAAGRITVSSCYEGLEARHVRIDGGSIAIRANDDGINALGGTDTTVGDEFASGDGSITVTGGTVSIRAARDAIDAKGSLLLSGGTLLLESPVEGGASPLSYTASATVTGGTVIGVGSSAAPAAFTSSTQGVLGLPVGSRTAGTAVTVKNAAGEVLVTHTPTGAYAYLLCSSPLFVPGECYTVLIGDEALTATAD
ncbi:MAG: carbohydrate-binding domain-containing protein [Clostridia bacterium]|nr:carbohydrate-binding domain-containing protein [Clostridia bacterium]